jgi:hypothetical protein
MKPDSDFVTGVNVLSELTATIILRMTPDPDRSSSSDANAKRNVVARAVEKCKAFVGSTREGFRWREQGHGRFPRQKQGELELLASLRSFRDRWEILGCDPVVSLRSTTGYRLASLPACMAKPQPEGNKEGSFAAKKPQL